MILLPSLMRPEKVNELMKSEPYAPITLWLNEADPRLGKYEVANLPEAWRVHVGPDLIGAGAIFREAFALWPGEEVYGFLGDDCVPKTKKWWKKLTRAAGDWCLAWPNDGHWRNKLSTHPFIGGELVRAVGDWAPEWCFHSFWDNYWLTVAKSLGLERYCKKVRFQHNHVLFQTADMDMVYEIAYHQASEDQAAYEKWARDEGRDLVNQVRLRLPREYRRR